MSESLLKIVVPMIPPSVNHYRGMNRGRFFVRKEATTFSELVKLELGNKFVSGETFSVSIQVYLGKKQRGDVDNFCKLVLDSLAKSGAFRSFKGHPMSDSHVEYLTVSKMRGLKPQTIIRFWRNEEE